MRFLCKLPQHLVFSRIDNTLSAFVRFSNNTSYKILIGVTGVKLNEFKLFITFQTIVFL